MKLLEQIKDAIRTQYVLVDDIEHVIDTLDSRSDEYSSIDDPHRLSQVLTEILREITDDKHFAVHFSPPTAARIAKQPSFDFAAARRRNNNYFYAARRLKGNIGYLDFRLFPDTSVAAETAIGAMAFLAGTDALIIDLRKNRGGTASMIQLLLTYFFADQTHLNTFYDRSNDEYAQSWTLAYVPGKRMIDVPVYVLISGGTGSAAEEFAYDVQQLKRGILVGQTTAGAGHTVSLVELEDGFSIHVPSGRPINPVSGTGWQGVGVQPDIEAPVENALHIAHVHALETLIDRTDEDEDLRAFFEWELTTVHAEHEPFPIADLSKFIGQYEDRTVELEGDKLIFQSPQNRHELLPLNDNTFGLDEDVRVIFSDNVMTLEWRDMPRRITFEKMVVSSQT